ncbi:MAG TPA: lysylphosphatidylglycerol synthase transmembrane domain-containing protein [Gaiellaceae bacterium]|nr:lysylphosphatidylglycerol synthase transmembrane domain-containing protein [Gaiellaceae bacterium]
MAQRENILGIDAKRALATIVIAVILLVGAFSLIGKAADFDEIVDALDAANRKWFPICLAGLVCAYAGYIAGYREIARMHDGPNLPFWTVTRIVGIGFGANVLGSAAGGLAVDFWALRRAGASTHDSARRVLGFNTLEWGLLGTFAAVAAMFVLAGRGSGAPLGMTLGWIIVVPVCVVLAAFVSSPKRATRLSHAEAVKEREGEGRTTFWWSKLKKGFADGIGGVVVVRHLVLNPRAHPSAILGFAVYWFGHLLTLYAALRAFTHSSVVLAALVLAFATGYVATALPLPGGGSGGIEAALAFSLHAVGMPLAPALLAALVYRFFTFWLPLLPALALLPSVKQLNSELPRFARQGSPA